MIDPDIEIRTLTEFADLVELGDVLGRVWGTDVPIVNQEMARAIAHSGGYVAGATFAQALGWNGARVATSYAACATGADADATTTGSGSGSGFASPT